jgi:aryl-alcohol dehydrogenase-like predicted oxidoreductase
MTETPLWTRDAPPRQGLGLMRLRDADGGTPDADRDPIAVVHAALDAGITLLDTAEMYGNEELVGRTIAGRRHEVTLCSKFGVVWGDSGRFDDWSVRADPASVVASCEASLKRLNVETIDLYYLHHRSEETPIEDTITAMATLVDSGKIRAVGLSNVTSEDIRRAHAVRPVLAVQEQWSLHSRDVESTIVPTVAELGITLVAHSPLGHGTVADTSGSPELARTLADIATAHEVSAEQIALAWVHGQAERRHHPVVPLPGSTSVRHVRANVHAATIRLADEDVRRLDEVSTAR